MKMVSRILFGLFAAGLILANANAQVFGWDGYSFNWTVFQQQVENIKKEHRQRTDEFGFYYEIVARGVDGRSDKQQQKLYERATKLKKNADSSTQVMDAKKDLFDLLLMDTIIDNPKPKLKIKDYSSIHFRSIRPASMYAIYLNQKKLKKATWFRLFIAGRRFGEKNLDKNCIQKPNLLIPYHLPWGVCIDAYFILSPQEASQFASEIEEIKQHDNTWLKQAGQKDMDQLFDILQSASQNGNAIMFVGHLFN